MALRDLFRKRKPKPTAPVWRERPPVEEVDALYQTSNSSDHTYYVATKRPRTPGARWASLGQELKLSGTGSNAEYAARLEAFINGDRRWLVFTAEPDNPHDPSAVQVYGVWTDRTTSAVQKEPLGWVDRDHAAHVSQRIRGSVLVGTPAVFFYGKDHPGLRFRIWYDAAREDQSDLDRLRESLLREGGASVAEAAETSGLSKDQVRNWLDKMATDEIVAANVREVFSGYRVVKHKKGRQVRYAAEPDATNIYHRKVHEQATDDPMGAEVPDYVLNHYV